MGLTSVAQSGSPHSAVAVGSESIAVLSNDPDSQEAVTAALGRQGWKQTYFYASQQKPINGPDARGQTMAQSIAAARRALGGEPAVWIVDVGSEAESAAATDAARVLAAIGTSSRLVVWSALGWSTKTISVARTAVNAAVEPIVSAWPNAVFAEWRGYGTSHDDESWWTTGTALSRAGQAEKANFLVQVHAGPPLVRDDLRWTPAKLTGIEGPARVGITYVDIRTLSSWNPTTSELRDQLTGLSQRAVVVLPAGRYLISGFQEPWLGGIRLGQAGKAGQQLVQGFRGVGRSTEIRLRPRSSSLGSVVPSQSRGGINPLAVMRFQDVVGAELTNLTLFGSDQGHLFNGVVFENCPQVRLEGVYVRGLNRGDASNPPGETFGISFTGGNNVVVKNCEFDGRDEITGKLVSSSMLGFNGPSSSLTNPSAHSHGCHLENVWFHDSLLGMTTWWLWNNIVTINYWSDNSGGQVFNHEEAGWDTTPVLHYNPSMIVRGLYEGRKPQALPGCRPENRSQHLSMWSHYGDQRGVKVYFLREDAPTFISGRTYKRHDRGVDVDISGLSVNNSAIYAGRNLSLAPARVFKASTSDRVVRELLPRRGGSRMNGLTSETAFNYYR